MKLIKGLILTGILILSFHISKSQSLQLLHHWKSDSLVSSQVYDNTYNEVWGFVQGDKEYAVIGSTAGTHIFLIPEGGSLEETVFIPGAAQGRQIIHRDYHDFKGYLYMVCDEGPSTLQIADLSFLPDSAPLVYDSNDLFTRAHNIFIDSANARMYTCGGSSSFSIYSLENPRIPRLLLNCQRDVPNWSTIGYVHDVYVEDNIAYCNAENRGLFVVDFSDTNDVKVLGSLTTYPEKGYNHSGWLHGNKKTYVMADETWNTRIKILDVEDLSDIKIHSLIGTETNEFAIAHNLIIREDFMYVSYYYDGVLVYDISNPEQPFEVARYQTSIRTHRRSYEGCWGIYPFLPSKRLIASDMQEGLFILDIAQFVNTPASRNEKELKFYPNPTSEVLFIEGATNPSNYEIFDIRGTLLQTGILNNSNSEIGLKNFSNGYYIIRINNGEYLTTHKFVKF